MGIGDCQLNRSSDYVNDDGYIEQSPPLADGLSTLRRALEDVENGARETLASCHPSGALLPTPDDHLNLLIYIYESDLGGADSHFHLGSPS